MGMDLYSVRRDLMSKESLYFRFNWHGWSAVCDFLDGLGCDLSEFRGSNDGDIVSPKSCRAIAQKIQEAWDAGKLMEFWKVATLQQWTAKKRSKTQLHYFSLDHAGVLNGESGEYWVADHKRGVIIPPSKNPYPKTLNYVLKCSKNKLPLVMGIIKKEMGNRIMAGDAVVFDLAVLEARLKGETYDPSRHIKLRPDLDKYEADDNEWSTLGYYMAFGKYCERCSHLRGFKQC